MKKDIIKYMKSACVLVRKFFGESEIDIDKFMILYEEEIIESQGIALEDENFNVMDKHDKIDYISDLIIGLRIKKNVISILEKVPFVDDEHVYLGIIPSIYDEILDDLGISIERYYDDVETTVVTRYTEIEVDEKEEVIESYVRKRNY